MTLADLIDLEAQLARDREASPEALLARDRRLLADAAAPRGGRPELLERWLAALRGAEPGPFPGRAVARALAVVRATLLVLGLALGWGAAAALLGFTGGHPVDVWNVVLALVLAQLVLLAFLLVALALPRATEGAPFLGGLRDAAGALVRWLASRSGAGRAGAWEVTWARLRARRSLYARVEPWLLLATTQGFGVAFNVGALVALLRAVVFSDVAFGWGTTLADLDPARLHEVVRTLAAPFGWLWPDAVPSLALVEATRYSRFEGAYLASGPGRAADPALVGGWWRFLAASIATYGLLPRVAALALASLQARRALGRPALGDAEVSRLVRRLEAPRVETGATGSEGPGATWTAGAGRARAHAPATRAALVRWREVPGGERLRAVVEGVIGCPVAVERPAGGRDEAGELDAAALGGADVVVVVAEGFEAPDRAARRLVASLREAAGPGREIRVLLSGADATTLRVWRDALERDPDVSVEPLPGGPT